MYGHLHATDEEKIFQDSSEHTHHLGSTRALKWGLRPEGLYFPGYEESSLQDDCDRPNLTHNKRDRLSPVSRPVLIL